MATKQISYDLPDSADLMKEATAACDSASFTVLSINDEKALEIATQEMNGYAKRVKELEEIRKSITRPMDAAKKNVMALFKPAITSYEKAIDDLKVAIMAYHREERKRLEAERREAEKRAAEERASLEAAAEDAETESQKAALCEVAASIVPESVAAPVKVAGATFVKRWKGRVVDLPALLRFVADNPEYADCVTVNQAAINRIMVASKGKIKLDGVEAYEDESVQAR